MYILYLSYVCGIILFLLLTIIPLYRYYTRYGKMPSFLDGILLLWKSYSTIGFDDI